MHNTVTFVAMDNASLHPAPATIKRCIGLLFLIPIPMQLLILTWFIFKKQIIKFYKNVMPAKLKSDKHKKDK